MRKGEKIRVPVDRRHSYQSTVHSRDGTYWCSFRGNTFGQQQHKRTQTRGIPPMPSSLYRIHVLHRKRWLVTYNTCFCFISEYYPLSISSSFSTITNLSFLLPNLCSLRTPHSHGSLGLIKGLNFPHLRDLIPYACIELFSLSNLFCSFWPLFLPLPPSPPPSPCLCLSVSLSLCLYVSLYVSLSVCLSVCLSVSLSFYLLFFTHQLYSLYHFCLFLFILRYTTDCIIECYN